jgi:adenylate cyclase
LAQSYSCTEESFAEAVVLARQALAIDPSYAPAAAMVGWSGEAAVSGAGHAVGSGHRRSLPPGPPGAPSRARRRRNDLPGCLHAVFAGGEAAMAAAALDRTLALNPNAAHAWSARGNIHAHRNEPEAAIEAIERARRLSPFDPMPLNALFVSLSFILPRDASNRRSKGPAAPCTTSPGHRDAGQSRR